MPGYGKIRQDVVRIIIYSGQIGLIGKIAQSWSPAAGHLRQPNMRCVGPGLE